MSIHSALEHNPLFADIDGNHVDAMLLCMQAKRQSYSRDDFVFMVGDRATSVGIVLTGGVRVVMDDLDGQRTILSHVGPGGLFGEAFSCAQTDSLPVSVVASENSEIMLIDYRKIVTTCSSSCAFHIKMIRNMLQMLAGNNILLTRKIEHISKRSTREKLLSFLSTQAVMDRSTTIEIPFNRQELADYLCVDRSALSRELSAMQADGIIKYEGKHFELLGKH
ncbi:Crp/Fnr family transcriptional regulator [Desulfovibrio sp. OttesenSCG-928-G15]|nr:Crp/Fnr family transcriptional regulator [Desulfovibrio sp. OttesenSCG-928-G15]